MLKFILLSLLLVTSSVFAESSTFNCANTKIVSTSTDTLSRMGFSGGVAIIDKNGNHIIKYDKQLESIPEMMNSVIAHECAHHILGHVSHVIRNYYANEQLQERPADCLATKMLERQLGYGDKEFNTIASFLRSRLGDEGIARSNRVQRCRLK